MNYGKQLEILREREGLSKTNMAKYLNIDISLYVKYEKEKQTIPIKHLNVICNYFNVSFDYIFGFTNKKMYNNYLTDIDLIKSGIKLKEIRKEKMLTQIQLAKQLNIAKSMIGAYEHGDFLISTHALYAICKKYNISADYLLGKVDSPKYLKEI